jgi:CBS domain containing-hemolysin-like protein
MTTPPMFALLLAVGLATLCSFLCSLAEAALYSISWSRIEGLRREGRKVGLLLFELRQNIEKPISAILTLNTIANTAGASVAGVAAADVFGPESLGLFAVAFTVIILIFGEIVPKTIGVAYSRPVAVAMARPLSWLVVGLAPVIWLLTRIVGFLQSKTRGPSATEDDIRAMVSLTRQAGLLKPFEELSIRNILSLDQKLVRDIMTPRTVVFSLPATMTVAEAKALKAVWPHSRIPIYEDDDREKIVGLVFRREVLEALANDLDDLALIKLMKPVEFVMETMTLDRLLVKFLESRLHLCVVLDEYGGVSGLVTLEDVLEEILGKEIVDETDQVVDMRELARQKRRLLVGRKS